MMQVKRQYTSPCSCQWVNVNILRMKFPKNLFPFSIVKPIYSFIVFSRIPFMQHNFMQHKKELLQQPLQQRRKAWSHPLEGYSGRKTKVSKQDLEVSWQLLCQWVNIRVTVIQENRKWFNPIVWRVSGALRAKETLTGGRRKSKICQVQWFAIGVCDQSIVMSLFISF